MASDEGISSALQLRLADAAVAVLGEHGVLDIPSRCANRSQLITELREHLDEDGESLVPLQLSWDEVKAWLACAEERGDTAAGASCSADVQDDASLVRALKAADFLRDEETYDAVADALGQALLGDTMSGGTLTSSHRHRAHQIVRALPAASVLAVLTTLHKRNALSREPIGECRDRTGFQQRSGDLFDVLRRLLLQLLPSSHHPAIIRTFCQPSSDPHFCIISVRESHGYAVATHNEVCQLIAAAAPLAGGSLDASADSFGHHEVVHIAQQQHNQMDCLCRAKRTRHVEEDPQAANRVLARALHKDIARQLSQLLSGGNQGGPADVEDPSELASGSTLVNGSSHCQAAHTPLVLEPTGAAAPGPAWEWQPTAGGLTRLELGVVEVEPHEAPRWCTALAQLHTLRALVVDVHCPLNFPVCEFTAALCHLPALVDLCIAYREAGCPFEELPASPGSRRLLEGLVKLTQLSTLELDGCYVTTPSGGWTQCDCAVPAIAELSRLAQLTCLRYAGMALASDCTRAFAGAVKRLSALEELHICFSADPGLFKFERPDLVPEAGQAAKERGLMTSLFQGPGLPRLKHLELSLCQEDIESMYEVDLQECHGYLRRHNPALLARMTALRLGPGLFGRQPSVGSDVAALIADMPALQSLSVPYLCHHTEQKALLQLSDVPDMPWPDEATRSPHEDHVVVLGVFAVLNALVQRSAAGREPLRELDIEGNCVGPAFANVLAEMLSQLQGLERLVISHVALWEEGLEVVLKAVATLPRLHMLKAQGNQFVLCPYSEEKEMAMKLSHGLEHVAHVELLEHLVLAALL